ncbi:energy-coupling factor transporter transmembrane component T family protein [Rothia kristinae]|uniref:ABC transporter permease n=1 Tax=Rothia kristinae TaxID=37923 RepID=A0A7T4MVD3_9MICC|nr:energy-coupling factor transporter transmembrane component T [Rothia kristinae]QQC60322.1 ABC transporter permease [Rothia kristinae]
MSAVQAAEPGGAPILEVEEAFPGPHPFTVLAAAAAACLIVTAAVGRPLFPVLLGALILGCAVIAARRSRLRRYLLACAAVLVPLWISQLLIHGLTGPADAAALASWGPFRLTGVGLEQAAHYGLRMVPLVALGVLCGVVLDADAVTAAVDESRLPRGLGYVLTATLALGPVLTARNRRIAEAHAVRGGARPGPLRTLGAALARAVPLVAGSVQEAEERSVHLQSRGFPGQGRLQRYRAVRDSRTQQMLRVLLLVAAVLGAGALLWS